VIQAQKIQTDENTMSIEARAASFDKYGFKEPTYTLEPEKTIVVRESTEDDNPRHEVTKIIPLKYDEKTAHLTIFFTHNMMFHSEEKLESLDKAIENLAQSIEAMRGAKIDLSFYIAKAEKPSADQFLQINGRKVFEPSEFANPESFDPKALSRTHRGDPDPIDVDFARRHIEYLFKKSRVPTIRSERFVYGFFLESEADSLGFDTVQNSNFGGTVIQGSSKYRGKSVAGDRTFSRGLFLAAKDRRLNTLRKWAINFSPVSKSGFRIVWESNDIALDRSWRFGIRFTYQHLDTEQDEEVAVTYVPTR